MAVKWTAALVLLLAAFAVACGGDDTDALRQEVADLRATLEAPTPTAIVTPTPTPPPTTTADLRPVCEAVNSYLELVNLANIASRDLLGAKKFDEWTLEESGAVAAGYQKAADLVVPLVPPGGNDDERRLREVVRNQQTAVGKVAAALRARSPSAYTAAREEFVAIDNDVIAYRDAICQ